MITLIMAIFLGLAPPGPGSRTALASRYADTRRDEGGTPACWGRIPDGVFDALYPIRCAHRTAPCGTVMVVARADGRGATLCAVLDRGPWCRVGPGCTRDGDAPFRGDLDLSPVPANAVGLPDGRVRVKYTPVWAPPRAVRLKRARQGNS